MGQKVNPIGFRIGVNRTWDSLWYAEGQNYANALNEDFKIRKYIKDFTNKAIKNAIISKIIIERQAKKIIVNIKTPRPGIIIGKKGSDIEKMKKALNKITNTEISLNIIEVKKADADATLIAQSMATQIEKRISYRRVMKKAIQAALKLGVKGIRINCAGRLSGAEIARMEWYREGQVPLHTIKANIDYAVSEANTSYGVIGIKVWVYKDDIEN